MKGERRSTAEETHLRWEEEEEAAAAAAAAEGGRCREHPFQPRDGVCPACLRDRLLRLCPDCANVRPSCACAPFSSSSSSSSSFSSLSFSADLPRSGTVGGIGRVSSLVEREHPFGRSGSVGIHLPRSRSIAAPVGGAGGGSGERRRWGWAALWPFARKESERNESASGAEGWKWHFPSPMKVFRRRKSEAAPRIVQERSPLYRG